MEKDFTMVLIKQVPGTKMVKTEEVINYIIEKGFSIVEPRWIVISKENAGLVYPLQEEWLKTVGNKVLKNCEEGNIDVKRHFATKDPGMLGLYVRLWNINFLSSNPFLALQITGKNGNTVQEFRNVLGPTDPSKAPKGSLRHAFRIPGESGILATQEKRIVYNTAHASDSPENAKREKNILWACQTWSPYEFD